MRNLLSTPDEGVIFGRSNDNFELLKAWAGTSLAFAIAQVGVQRLASSLFVEFLLISMIVCGLGFVLHELAHRIVARNYGAEAHFVANDRWLILSVIIALAGFFIAAPGAVWHRGYLTPRQGGQIALAGPATNLVLALVFLLAYPLLYQSGLQGDWFYLLCLVGVSLNAWLGLFNMIPAGPFDGAKVLAWNTVIFGVTVAIGIVLTFFIASPRTLLTIWSFLIGQA
jgi:Zn-dependent protease